MAKRKATHRNFKKKITRVADKRVFIADKRESKFSSHYIKKDSSPRVLRNEFKKRLQPEFESFYDSRSKKKNSKLYIFRFDVRHNLKGKRIRKGYSTRRVKIKNKREFDLEMEHFLEQILADFERYLKRKDMRSISIFGTESEVLQNAKATRTKSIKKSKRTRRKK